MNDQDADNYVGVITTPGYFLCRACGDKAEELDRYGPATEKVYARRSEWKQKAEKCDACDCEVRH